MASAYRIAIVGSGPAGLSAAAHAATLGLSHVLLEKSDRLADTIHRYQRGKHVMATPVQLQLRSDCGFEAGSREAVLARWSRDAEPANVRLGADVTAITGALGDFALTLADGEVVRAETVVLAIGTQGNPNQVRCDGAALPHVQYQLDDPTEYIDEHIVVVGGGDAGIENALGLAADPAQANVVTLLNRSADFARAKPANVEALYAARDTGRLHVLTETTPTAISPGWIELALPEGEQRIRCDRVIARLGSLPPRGFVERCGATFASPARDAFPTLGPTFETSTPGLYVIGALAGYPLIKHCLNQGHDVVEFIAGNTALKPVDEPVLEAILAPVPGADVAEKLARIHDGVDVFREMSLLQMREFLLDSDVRWVRRGDVLFRAGEVGASLFGVIEGRLSMALNPKEPDAVLSIEAGDIVGEVALISGRPRSATVTAQTDTLVVEISRTAALKLMAQHPAARDRIERIVTARQLLVIFNVEITPDDLAPVLETAEVRDVAVGDAVYTEGDTDDALYVLRAGSVTVERTIGDKPVFLSYLPAGSYFGEGAAFGSERRTETVRAAVRSRVVRVSAAAFRAMLDKEPALRRAMERTLAEKRRLTEHIEAREGDAGGAVDLYTRVAGFLVKEGLGDATDVLLIDERLCIGCDNCENACADSHEGLSRLDREAGRSYAHLHVPTSCRHCEHAYCMTDCPPDAIHRGADGEVVIDSTCIGCGACQRNCPYDVIRMEAPPPPKPGLLNWLLFGAGPGPGEAPRAWRERKRKKGEPAPVKQAVKCDMCSGREGGPSCVKACPTGAALRVSPEEFLSVTLLEREV